MTFSIDGHEVFVTASIGIAHSATGYRSPDEIMRDADIAMYRAKAAGKARYEVFDREHAPERRSPAQARDRTPARRPEQRLRDALPTHRRSRERTHRRFRGSGALDAPRTRHRRHPTASSPSPRKPVSSSPSAGGSSRRAAARPAVGRRSTPAIHRSSSASTFRASSS